MFTSTDVLSVKVMRGDNVK